MMFFSMGLPCLFFSELAVASEGKQSQVRSLRTHSGWCTSTELLVLLVACATDHDLDRLDPLHALCGML